MQLVCVRFKIWLYTMQAATAVLFYSTCLGSMACRQPSGLFRQNMLSCSLSTPWLHSSEPPACFEDNTAIQSQVVVCNNVAESELQTAMYLQQTVMPCNSHQAPMYDACVANCIPYR